MSLGHSWLGFITNGAKSFLISWMLDSSPLAAYCHKKGFAHSFMSFNTCYKVRKRALIYTNVAKSFLIGLVHSWLGFITSVAKSFLISWMLDSSPLAAYCHEKGFAHSFQSFNTCYKVRKSALIYTQVWQKAF
jgi:hypothetical protein